MKIAFGHMGYAPDTFWSLSLREWQAALAGYTEKHFGSQETPLTHPKLHKLMKDYPDDR